MTGQKRAIRLSAAATAIALVPPGWAEPLVTNSYTLYGTPGLVEMPTAESAPDADLSTTFSYAAGQRRTTLSFQISPRLSGSFRYARIPGYETDGSDRYDRSFDIRYRFLDESTWLPAVAIGFQDFVGTGLYSAEYLVATKSFGPTDDIRVSAGLGWGRLATAGVIAGEEGSRVTGFEPTGGTANFDQFFTGPVALFGGVSWDVTDRLSFKAEYSTDGYTRETERDLVDLQSPWNFGLDYEISKGARIGAYSLYGNEFGLQFTLVLNPTDPPYGSGIEEAPAPVQPRPARSANQLAWSNEWISDDRRQASIRASTRELLAADGIELDSIALRQTNAEIRIRNTRYGATSQAIGRTARILTRTLPATVETFRIVPVIDGVPASAITLSRSDVEQLESAPGRVIVNRADVTGAGGSTPRDLVQVERYPRLTYGIGPYLEVSLFDPDAPIRGNLGLTFSGDVLVARGLEFSGEIRQPLVGNIDEIERESNSVLPRVRSNYALYVDDMDPILERLTAAHFGRLGDDYYSRVTAGYLERMFAGVSGEVLWKPVDSRLAFGVELNYVQQRDPEDAFGLIDYDVVTGHASVYYDIGNGYYGQVDVGRYLAGDDGATFTLDRTFDNGWRVGAYATFTDVPFEDFGEGSFDKGIRITVPLEWLSGQPSRRRFNTVLQPLTRDGGARLNVDGRLYDRVRDSHRPALQDRAGRFWR